MTKNNVIPFKLTDMVGNAVRRLENLYPGYFASDQKHNHYKDYGYPKDVTFDQLWTMYRRNGFAHAAIEKTILKTWETKPVFHMDEDADELNSTEQGVFDHFEKIRFWQMLAEADRRSMVGGYAGLMFRIADNQALNTPVRRVRGLEQLVQIIPAWAGQLDVERWDDDPQSETYGQPLMYTFNEANVTPESGARRSFTIHPDRVFIWSKDTTLFCESDLLPGFNDLLTLEKLNGAGGEGFWKNAKSGIALEVDKEARIADMAKTMGVDQDELADAMNEQVEEFNKGFDAMLLLQGMKANSVTVTMPQPEQFREGPLQSFASSMNIPQKILTGMQTGERASTEDASEWAKTNEARRENFVIPNVMAIQNRLASFGVMLEEEWTLKWDDLTDSTLNEKVDRADKMASVNQKQSNAGGDELIFNEDEIREAAGFKALADTDRRPIDDEIDERDI